MKRNLTIAFAGFAMIALTSCKKDYTCECTTTVVGLDPITQNYELKDAKKKDAEDACDQLGLNAFTTCTLK